MSMNAVPNDSPPVAGGGEPPYDKDMDRRLTVLETRFDTILPTLATKSDLEALRAEFRGDSEKLRGEFEKLRGEFEKLRGEVLSALERSRADLLKSLNDTMKWIFGLGITLIIGVFGLGFAMLNAIKNIVPVNVSASVPAQASPALPASPVTVPTPIPTERK